MTCPEAATGLGAYLLGALEPDERAHFEQHLRSCPACAAELAEFAALPALLDRVRPEDLRPTAVAPSTDMFDRLSAAAAPTPFRARTWALVAAAVLAVAGLGVGATVWASGSGDSTVTASSGAVRATVTASGVDDDGSVLVVSAAGMHPGEICHLVVVDTDGNRHAAGVWPASAAGDGTWRGWADVDRDHLRAVLLTGDDGRELVRVPF